jgi:hypothetical protein
MPKQIASSDYMQDFSCAVRRTAHKAVLRTGNHTHIMRPQFRIAHSQQNGTFTSARVVGFVVVASHAPAHAPDSTLVKRTLVWGTDYGLIMGQLWG